MHLAHTDNAADPRAMTFTSADGSKTVEYTLSDAACFTGIGQKYCKYITTELITERTEHKVGDTMEYEYTTREVTNAYHLTYDPEKGFSPVTFEDSISNSASLDEGWNVVAESGGGQSDPTVEQATRILLDAVETSKAKSPEEAIRVITEAKEQATELVKKELERLEEQKQHLYAIDRWDLTERQMHLLGAERSIEKLAKQALYDRGCQDAKDWLRDPNRTPLTSKDLDADYTRGFSETVKDYFEKVFRERGDACVPDDMFDLGVVLAIFAGTSGLAGAVAVAAYQALSSAYLWGGVAFYKLLQKLGSGWQRLWNFFRGKGGAAAEPAPGTLSSPAARAWYNSKVSSIDSNGLPTRDLAKRVFEQRNAYKQWSRDLMADREAAAKLAREYPLKDFQYYVDKYYNQGYRGEDLWTKIIEVSKTTNKAVNQEFGQ